MNTHLAVHQQQNVVAKIGSAIHNWLAALLVDFTILRAVTLCIGGRLANRVFTAGCSCSSERSEISVAKLACS